MASLPSNHSRNVGGDTMKHCALTDDANWINSVATIVERTAVRIFAMSRESFLRVPILPRSPVFLSRVHEACREAAVGRALTPGDWAAAERSKPVVWGFGDKKNT